MLTLRQRRALRRYQPRTIRPRVVTILDSLPVSAIAVGIAFGVIAVLFVVTP